MQRRNKLLLLALMTALVALAVAVPAAAATTDTTSTTTTDTPRRSRAAALEIRSGGWTAVCELLDMTPAEIAAKREAGKSLVQIALSKGVSAEKLLSTMVEPRKAALDKLVASGKITQERADTILKAMTERLTERINSTETRPYGVRDRFERDRLERDRLDRDDISRDCDERPAGDGWGRGGLGRGMRGVEQESATSQ